MVETQAVEESEQAEGAIKPEDATNEQAMVESSKSQRLPSDKGSNAVREEDLSQDRLPKFKIKAARVQSARAPLKPRKRATQLDVNNSA